ncbi:MAG: hypothetical protein V2B18_10310 [Pseudomonadota bacterium]
MICEKPERAESATRSGYLMTQTPRPLNGRMVFRISAFLFAIVVLSGSSAPGSDIDARVAGAIELCGLSAQLEMLSRAVFSALSGYIVPCDRKMDEGWNLLKRRADKSTLLPLLHGAVRSRLVDETHLDAVTNFYSSGIGKKIARAGAQTLNPEVLAGLRENRHMSRIMSPERRSLLERVAKAQQVAEINFRLLEAAVRGLGEGAAKMAGKEERTGETTAMMNTAVLREQSGRKASAETAPAALARSLHGLTDVELGTAAVFFESPAGKWFQDAVTEGLEAAVFKTGFELGAVTAGMK